MVLSAWNHFEIGNDSQETMPHHVSSDERRFKKMLLRMRDLYKCKLNLHNVKKGLWSKSGISPITHEREFLGYPLYVFFVMTVRVTQAFMYGDFTDEPTKRK